MANRDIINYIRETRGSGFSDDQIKDTLKTAGWLESDISDSFNELNSSTKTYTAEETAPASPTLGSKINLGEPIQVDDKDLLHNEITKKIQNVQVPIDSLKSGRIASQQTGNALRSLLEEEEIGSVNGTKKEALSEPDSQTKSPIQGSDQPVPSIQGVKQTSSSRRFLIPALITIGLIGIAGVGVFAFNTLRSNPTKIVENAFINWSQAQTYSYSGKMQFNLSAQTSQTLQEFNEAGSNKYRTQLAELNNQILNDNLAQAQVTTTNGIIVNFSGTTDFSDNNNVKKSLVVDVPESPNLPFGFGFEATIIDGRFYLKPTKISAPSELDINFLLNQAVLIDLAKFATILEEPSLTTEAQKLTSSARIKSEDISVIKDKYQIFSNLQSLPSETIANQNTHHFGFTGANQFGTAMEEILSKDTLPLELITTIKEMTEVAGEVWIGKDDNMPVKIKLTGVNGGNKTELELNFNKYNEPLNIVAPENPKLLGLVIFELFDEIAKSGIELPNIPSTLFIDSDKDGLYDVIEDFYSTDPNNNDTDNDSYIDGEEVKNNYNPAGQGRLEY